MIQQEWVNEIEKKVQRIKPHAKVTWTSEIVSSDKRLYYSLNVILPCEDCKIVDPLLSDIQEIVSQTVPKMISENYDFKVALVLRSTRFLKKE